MKTKLSHLIEACLPEECAEIIQVTSKIQRFGLEDVWPNKERNPGQLTTRERLIQEINDFHTVLEMIEDDTGWDLGRDPKLMEQKRVRLLKYMEFSRSKGLLE